jgi:hypothetical protein
VAGFDSRKVITNRTANNNPRGSFTFGGISFPRNDALNLPAATSSPISDFLLGVPSQVVTPGALYPGGGEQWRYGFFVQDKWQVSTRLTVTYGLRYELPTVPQSTTGNATILNPQQTAFIPATVPSKIPLNGPDHNNFAPRFGFAYRMPSKFVIRGGFGLYYNPNQMNSYTLATTNPPFSSIFTYNQNIVSPNLTLNNPIPPVTPSAPSQPNAFTLNPYLPNATLNQWSLSLERGLWRTAGLAIEYLGSHGYHLDRSFYNNTPAPGPGSIASRRPNQLFGEIRTIQNDLISNYQGLSFVFRQQGFKGLTMLASYTWSHTTDIGADSNGGSNVMDPYNWRRDYGNANWDIRHRFVSSFNYELPFFLSSSSKLLKNTLGGWQANGVITVQTGFPFTVGISADQANAGRGAQRPDVIAPVTVNCGPGYLTNCISGSSFALPSLYTYGNLGRNTFTGPGLVNADLSFFKNIALAERFKLQFRTELFNSLNHPAFSNPAVTWTPSSVTPGATNFGSITTTSNNNRQIQFGLKLLF